MTYYERLMQQKAGGAPTLSPAASLYAKDKDEEEKKKNRGWLLGGLGYVGEKLGLGLLQGIEGVWDYAAGGIADLFGADAWAERQFSSDWLNYNHADDWYNPGEGWKVAGDVTGGIGTSLPGILTAAGITLATGGSGAAAGVGLAVGSLSAAGTSTKEAMQESGELTGKEYLYGAGMGAVEAVTEKLSGGLGAGVTKAAKSVGKAFGKVAAKETAEAAAKSAAKKGVALSLKTAAKSAGKEFASEAFEEGFSEWIAPYIARATYNPNAQNATAEEVFYSALVGGLSGVGTAGGVGAFVQLKNVKSGTVIADEGRAKQILSLAKRYTEDGFSNTEDAQGIREIYEKLAPTVERGEALNIEQRRMLGELNSFEMAEQLRPTLQRSALTAVQSADAIAERLNADGRYKMVNDKFVYVDSEKSIPEGATVREITAEDITKGYDPSKKDSIKEAIQKNDVLRYIAASDAAGRFIMTAKDFEKAALSGQKIQSQADLNYFIENASAEQKAAVGKELGVTDWNTLNIEGFNERAAAYRESGKAEAYKQKTAKIEKMKQLADSKPKSIPRAIALADGDVKHYADADSNIAIARTGDTFLVYDYKTGNVTRDMTRAEVNAELARYRQSKSATTETTNATTEKTSENFSSDAEIEIKDEKISKTAFENEFSEEKSRPTVKEIKAANEAKEQAKRFDALAKEKIKDYDGLSEANKSMIRKIFREAEANGISESDALSYARVSARTGLDITFDKKACYKGKNEAGADVYHAGFYDPESNRIVVNPETKKKHTVLLIHELSHAMRSYRKNGEVKYFIDDDAKVSEEMWKEIRKYYADENGKVDEGLTLDEASAYYAEAIFGTEGAINLLLGEKPTLKQKILSFFAKSAEYYSTDEKLSKEARRHFRKFKAMFDAFTARNYGRNAEAGLAGDKTDGRRYSFSSIAFSFHGVDNMTAAEFESKDYKKTEGYKAYVEECLNNMRQTQKGFDEKAARKQIEKSIDGIVSVAVAMKKAGYDIADTAEQRSVKDTKNRLLFSSLEPNSDYFTSSDISTICDKRKNFAEIYDDIVRAEEAKGVPKGKRFFDNVDNYFYIHKVLADKGLTQPCRQCYVESMRKNLAPMANAFLTLVQEADGNNTKNPQLYNQSGKDKGKIKANNADTREAVRKILDGYGFSPESLTVEMLTTEDGLAEMKITMPELYERFNSFYGQSKPKMPKGATPFRFGELTALLTDNHGKIKESLVKKINSTGGFRLQSYSDFQIQNYADVLQVIFEAGTLGLHGHAYTKVPAFIDATANTNLKRNMSIFMYNDNGQWKIDRNDSFPYTLEKIYELEKADESGNTGIIAVVQNEDMASWVMANDNVGYFIPFHKSGIKMGVVRETIVKEDGREIKGYKDIKDHTRQQTEVWAKTSGENKANTKVRKPINIYDFWDFNNAEKLSQKKLIEKNLKKYIDECEKHGYLPKFREYVMGNDKVLKNVLKYAKELGTVSESATVSDISFEYKGYTIPYGYYKCLGDFSMFKPDGTASPIQPLSLENYDFAKAVKLFSDAESVRRNEIIQQFANGTEREYYRNSTMTAEELQKVIDTKRTEVVNEIVGKSARRAAMEVSGDVASKGRYTEPTDIKTIIKDIEAQNEIENMVPEGLSKDFVKAIKRSGGFAHPRLYRGMEAAELDSIIENGYIKSNSSYNFANQQGQTRFTPKIQTALSYATGFAPAGIYEKFYEQGMPAYIVEIGNYTDLGIKNEDTIESYTVKNVDKKYITRIIELMYDAQDNSIKATDIEIDGMNAVNGETVHGIPAFMRDSVTGTILYEHQDEDGFEDGKYISEKNPDILFDYDMVESYKESTFDYNSYLGISGDEQNLVPYGQDMKTKAVSFMNELSLAENVDRILHMDDNEALANKKAGSYISISKSTPSFILEKVRDAKNLELIMRFDSFYLATRHSGVLKGHYHNYGKIMSELPKIISRPLAIVRMNDGRLNILSEIKTAKGDTSIVSVELSSSKDINGKNDKYNVVVTILPAKDNYVKNNLENRGVRVEYEKEDLPQVNNQLHKWLATINGKSSNDIIPDSEQKSNPSDENSSKKSSESGKRASMDADYMTAVNRGDMVTAQRMVDEAAEKAMPNTLLREGKAINKGEEEDGTLIKMYHGSGAKGFYKFKARDGALGKGIYLTSNWDEAVGYAIEKLGIEESEDGSSYNWNGETYDGIGSIGDALESEGYVRSFYANVTNESDITTSSVYWEDVISLVRDENQLKSADPVTYDDDGNVIPLSERFNPKKSDIRYSSETIENVGKSRFDEPDVKFREKIKAGFVSAKDKLYIEAVDELYGVEKYLTKFGGRKDAESFVQQVRASETISQTMIGVAQYDITNDKGKRLGDGLTKIFKKYKLRGISDDFDDYLLHQLNVDRMTLNERSLAWKEELRLEYEKAQKAYDKAKKLVEEKKKKSVPRKIGTALTAARNAYESFEVLENKPVFGENEKRAKAITAEESRKIIAELEKEHPEFKDSAEEVWAYSKNLQAMRVSSGLISQESADIMAKYYPHYVPSFRDKTKSVGAGTVKNASQLAVNSTIKKSKGGGEDIYSVEESLAAQTRQTVKAMQINRMANAVYEAAISSGDTSYVMTKEAEKQMKNTDPDADDVIDLVAKNNQIVFFRDGKKMEMNVAQEIFDGFKGVTSGSVPDSLAVRMSSKVLGGFKNLVTQLSPAFAVRNFVRDLQDALINTKHPRKFIKQLKGALSDMATNGNEWQLYLAYGGFASTVFDAKGFTHGVGERGFEAFRQISGIDESSFKKIGKGLKNVLTVVGNANAFIEQLTRFMEFKASLAAGDSIQTAINNSAEVTTNFSRHGKVVKVLNATFIPFLNASVQGFDKLLRVISGPFKEQSLAAIAILFSKILAIGIAPQILNMLMYGDEEDYEDLTNEVRENYFLIKAGDQYIKIPRGRAAGAFGGIANRIGNVTRGDSFDLPGYLESLKNNVTPLDSFTRDIFSPFRDVATNTTWYGGEIEGRQFENVRPSQRYDESTSSIAVALGGAFNYSPKKIHYLLDQYSGVIGDFLLPVTTKKAEKDYLSANFLIDPKTNNKLSDEFYKLYDDAQFAKNEGDETAYYQLRHLNDVKDSVSNLYDDIESIQKSNKKNSDKLNEVRTIRALINNLYKTAKTDYAAYTKAIESTAGMFDETTESGKRLRHTVITKMMYGSEKALEEYNSDVYEKSQLFNKAGMSYDTFYEYYFTTKFIEPDTDRRGEKIEGSKRKNTIAAINKLNATREEKLLMIVSSGYALKDGDIRGISAANAKRMLLKYILSMKGTQAEKAALAEACGFEVKNGKILKNSL